MIVVLPEQLRQRFDSQDRFYGVLLQPRRQPSQSALGHSLDRAERRRGILSHLSVEFRSSNTRRTRFAGVDPDGAVCHSPHCRRLRRAVGSAGDAGGRYIVERSTISAVD